VSNNFLFKDVHFLLEKGPEAWFLLLEW
jgi:hypothetical protein